MPTPIAIDVRLAETGLVTPTDLPTRREGRMDGLVSDEPELRSRAAASAAHRGGIGSATPGFEPGRTLSST
ncbi:MAG TPA: hypothetical protein PKC43_02910 [Phycisphaerales bacterium]|nr:hypothetical protein [Phycisphaerales bacterium]HMP36377.1 hypothetical protein [Phycisphaerales bacterium]